jgi:hypothetical protein
MKSITIEIVFDKEEDYIPRINRTIEAVALQVQYTLVETLKDGDKVDCGTYRYNWKSF